MLDIDAVQKSEPNPFLKANILSRISQSYINGLVWKGFKSDLTPIHMYQVMEDDSALSLSNRLQGLLSGHGSFQKSQVRSLRLSLILFLMLIMIKNGLILLVEHSLTLLTPVFIGKIIEYYSPNQTGISFKDLILYTVGVSVQAWVVAFSQNYGVFLASRAGMNLRVALSDLIFSKALKLDTVALQTVTTGYVINLMSTDVQKLEMMLMYINYLWIGPLQLIAVTSLLWPDLGPSSLAGMSLIVLLIPLNGFLGKMLSKFTDHESKLTDKRVSLFTELIRGISVIKIYSWESSFWTRITDIRMKEMVQKTWVHCMNMIAVILYMVLPNLVCLATFSTFYFTSSEPLTVSKVFKALTFYRIARLAQIYYFIMSSQLLFEGFVAIKRIQSLLDVSESPNPGYKRQESSIESDPLALSASSVVCLWNMDSQHATLNDLNFKFKKGELTMISGPVGSGKSSLLMAILGELPIVQGELKVNGGLAYCSQQAWIFSGTVRQNILFGKPYHESRYNEVVAACALGQDFKSWPSGDLSCVGGGGTSLSGGQKARVVLARTAYAEADIYLLDDPLSALDARVGQHVFEHLLCGFLGGKTRILVTHHLHFLDKADHVLILDKGSVVGQGTLSGLLQQDLTVASFLSRHSKGAKEAEPSESASGIILEEEGSCRHLSEVRVRSSSIRRTPPHGSLIQKETCAFSTSSADQSEREAEEEEEEEEWTHSGVVSSKVYWTYIKYGTGYFLVAFLLGIIAVEAVMVLTDWWLGIWAESEDCYNSINTCPAASGVNRSSSNIIIDYLIKHRSQNLGILIFTAISVFSFLTVIMRSYSFLWAGLRAARSLHSQMLQSVVKAPLFFFSQNTPGKVINRFSKDMFFLDGPLPSAFEDAVLTSMECLSSVVLNAISQPYVMIGLIPLGFFCYGLQKLYLRSSRQVRRLEGIARSPIFGYLNSSLQGLVNIRAAGFQLEAAKEFRQCLDNHTKTYFIYIALNQWFAVRMDIVSSMFITIALFIPVIALWMSKAAADQTVLGLALMYAINITGYLDWAVRQSSEVENKMTSVERILEFVDIPGEEEDPGVVEPPPDWPDHGSIAVDHVDYRHDISLPPVLKQLVFAIRKHEKVGIIGRTGAGKSSLLTMFLRMGHVEGRVTIDGIDLATVPLKTLRSRMSIIPQDPLLFSGSIRQNLDPFLRCSDSDIWKVLSDAHMSDAVQKLEGGLETNLVEFGANFSVGQRQLLCMARALLRKSRILFMDEATANIDIKTDKLIQNTVKTKFLNCTVLIVAHRLQTVMDCDRILVLHEGQLVEFDEPVVLLQRLDSSLRSMAEQTGSDEFARLVAIAGEAAEERRRLGLLP